MIVTIYLKVIQNSKSEESAERKLKQFMRYMLLFEKDMIYEIEKTIIEKE